MVKAGTSIPHPAPFRLALPALLLMAATTLSGCKTKHTYPEGAIGWHTANYSVVFGRLIKLPPKTADSDPVWVIRFGRPEDPYGGELALTPPSQMTGYAGGERVEVRGQVDETLGHPDYAGKWYQVASIHLWQPRR